MTNVVSIDSYKRQPTAGQRQIGIEQLMNMGFAILRWRDECVRIQSHIPQNLYQPQSDCSRVVAALVKMSEVLSDAVQREIQIQENAYQAYLNNKQEYDLL